MNLRKVIVLFSVVSALGAFAGGCQSGGVGDPCTPEDEYQQRFSGFSPTEINIESRSFQCETRVCLVNHFRGRVTCPLGQDESTSDAAKRYTACNRGDKVDPITGGALDCANIVTADGKKYSPQDPKSTCRVPGSSGAKAEVIEVSVLPQCKSRQAKDTVYCSCRCDGPDKSAKYCDCPSGFSCTPLEEFDLGAAVSKGSANLRGSYCIKSEDVTPANKLKYTGALCKQSDTYDNADDSCKDGDGKSCGGVNPLSFVGVSWQTR
jgi:hypothetical protein